MSILENAVKLAFEKHIGTYRKGDGQPYIFHPLEVMSLASLMTKDPEVLCAAVLHDTIEDTDCTKDEVLNATSQRVVDMVASETEDKRGQVNKSATWQTRKQEAIDNLKKTKDIGAKIVCLADKVSNLRSFNRLLLANGEAAWDNFNMKDPKMHYWYYDQIRQVLKDDLEDQSVYKEYCFLIDSIFNKYMNEKGE